MKVILITLFFIFSGFQYSLPVIASELPCTISLSADSIDFGTVLTGDESIKTISITNTSTSEIRIDTIFTYSRWPVFSVLQSGSLTIQPGQKQDIPLLFKTPHNITHTGQILFRISCPQMRYSIPLSLKGRAQYSETEFSFTQDLDGQALYNALNTYLNQAIMFTYADARQHMFSKADNVNGTVECAYTGRKIQTTGIPSASIFNTEHSWPQSKGADKEPARSDIFHLYPTDSKANEKRSNHPYGIVSRSIAWELGGSKLGLPQSSADTVFEPRDIMKGNIARGILYFATRYGNRKGSFDQTGFLTNMESIIRNWNKQDPVDERERDRALSIASVQKRMNPYIAHPNMIDRMFKLATQPDFPLYPEPTTDSLGIFANVLPDDSITMKIPIINKGNQLLKINSTEFRPSITNARVLAFDSIIKPASYQYITITMKSPIDKGTLLRLRFADGIPSLFIPFSTKGTASSVSDIAFSSSLMAYPNPAHESRTQIITFSLPKREQCTVKLFDMQGKELKDYSQNIQWDGLNASISIQHDISNAMRMLTINSTQYSSSLILHTGF
jgi:endonuclease I